MKAKDALVMAANWDSNVGYAWWLIESLWIKISEEYSTSFRTIICYPSISTLPSKIIDCPADKIQFNFIQSDLSSLVRQFIFIIKNRIKFIYFTDKSSTRLVYFIYRLAGVKKIVIHDHTPGNRTAPGGIKKILKIIKSRLPFITADACFAATDFVKHRLINVNCLPAYKCFSVNNGIAVTLADTPVFDIRTTYHLPHDSFIVTTASRAHQYKGIEFALRVFKKISEIEPDNNIYYLFIGDGPHLIRFKALADQLDINNKIVFVGRVSDVHPLLASANCAFHPSYGEIGYSLSILEYMRDGLPLLVSDNPSVCQATPDGKTGLLYKEHNIDDAAEKLIRLWKNPGLLAAMSIHARQLVVQNYSLESTHKLLLSHFHNLIAR